VWMQRYLPSRRRPGHPLESGLAVSVHPCHRPAYVCAKIKSLQVLLTL